MRFLLSRPLDTFYIEVASAVKIKDSFWDN